jgi:MFS family permease
MTKQHKRLTPYLIVLLAALFYTYEYLLRIEPSVMVHYLMHSYGIYAAAFSIMVGMYYYAYTPLQLVVGVLTDRYGPRRALITALATCLLGACLFTFFKNYYVLCVGRLLIGAGSAFAFVGAVKLAAMWLPPKRFAVFAGFCTSLGMLGAMIGDLVLSWGMHKVGVRSILVYTIIAGVVLLLLFILFLQNKKDYAAARGSDDVENFSDVFKGLISIMRRTEFWFVGMMGAVLYLSLSGVAELWGIAFFKRAYPINHMTAASLNSMIFLGWLIGAPFIGWLSDRIRMRARILVLGCFLSAIICFVIIWFPPHDLIMMHGLLLLFGITCSSEILVFAYVRDHVGSALMATAASFMNLLVMCSGMIAQPLLGWLLDYFWSGRMQGHSRFYALMDYQKAMTFVPIMLVLGGLIGLIWYWHAMLKGEDV